MMFALSDGKWIPRPTARPDGSLHIYAALLTVADWSPSGAIDFADADKAKI